MLLSRLFYETPYPIPAGICRSVKLSDISATDADDDFLSCGSCGQAVEKDDLHIKKNGKIGTQCHRCFNLQQARRLAKKDDRK